VYFAVAEQALNFTEFMKMTETVRSLRLYFILSGLAGLFVSGSALRVSLQSSVAIGAALHAISIAFSLAFLYGGFCLAGLLRTSSGRILALLYASAGWSVLQFLLSFLRTGRPFGLVTLLLVLLIVWYLLKNVERLAAESQVVSPRAIASGS
jgi:hypothetical protein